ELDRLSIPVHTEVQVLTIQKKSNRFLVKTNKGEFTSDQLILATGGKALPASGSDGSGYAYAMSLGHSIRNVYPSINKLKLNSPHLKHLSGVKIKSSAILYVNEEPIQIEEDDILFTAVGISGPTILQLSREATLAYEAGKHVEIGIKLLPTMLIKEVVSRLKNFEDKTIEQALIGLVNKRFIGPLVKDAGLPSIHTLVSSLSKREKEDLINLLFDWRFEVSGYLGFEEAQATIGGVSIPEINPLTMESNLVPGLYFAGEVMDVDGRCGGYNLQWAWTSGYLAGLSSAIAEKNV
ncbi:MAG: aminoacetone oxidase family FAD-binding enzyme, partial [Candidatus Izemoplasmatales bacterium]